MDENVLQEWSEALAELREKRADDVEARRQQKSDFSPADFFEIALPSLDAVLERWLQYERRSAVAADVLKSELESVHEFELEAIHRDLAAVRGAAQWTAADVEAAAASFQTAADQVKQKYQLKIASPAEAAAKADKKKAAAAPAPVRYAGSSGGASSGSGMALMFLVGLALGAGPSVYFWDQAKKAGGAAEAERTKLAGEKRSLEDGMALLRTRFDQLAAGELKSLPEIERTEEKIRREADEKKRVVEELYAKEKDRILKKVPAGQRQDEAMAANEEKRNASLSEIEAATAQAIEPFEKQKATLQEMRAR